MQFFLNWIRPQKPPITQLLRVMKLIIILLTTAFLQVSASGYSQLVNFTGKNVSLQTVFNAIKQQSGYTVFCNAEILADAPKVSVKLKDAPVEEAIQKTLHGQKLSYSIIGKTIVVKEKSNPLPATTMNTEVVAAKNIDVRGRVVNEKGEPVAGVTVRVKGTKNATAANANGEFVLQNVDENAVLVITSVNSQIKEVNVNGRTNLGEVTVMQKVGTGEEIVVQVNTGYQTLPKERATGAFDIISRDKIEKRVLTNVKEALEGQAPGLSTFKGNVLVRGLSTFSSEIGTEPLIVIDGMPTERKLDDININDVETLTILKDAAASSIYGVRAANGVIVITTKGGRLSVASKTSIQFTTDLRWEQNPTLKDYHYASTKDIMDYELALMSRNAARSIYATEQDYLNNNIKGIGEAGTTSNSINYITPLQRLRQNFLNGNISQADYDATLASWAKNDYRKEYMDLAWQTPLRQSYNLSLSSSSKNQSTFASLNYVNNGQKNKYNTNEYIKGYLKSTQRLNNWLTFDIGTDIQYNHRVNVQSSYANMEMLEPYTAILDANGNKVYRDYVEITGMQGPLHINPEVLEAINGLPQFESFRFNILDELNDNLITQHNYNVRSFARFNINVNKNFKFSSGLQYEFAHNKEEDYRSKNSYYIRFLRNRFANYNAVNSIIPVGGRMATVETSEKSWVWRNQVDFDKKIGSDHQVNAVGGIELRQIATAMPTNSVYYGYDPTALTYTLLNTYDMYTVGLKQSYIYNNNTSATAVLDGNYIRLTDSDLRPTLSSVTNRYMGIYGTGGYTYKNKYGVSASVRVDQTNLFGTDPKYRYRPLWSAGVKWNMAKEDFLRSVNWIDYLDFRFSYGLTGNVDQTTTPYLVASLANQSTYTAQTIPYASISSAPNPLLRWEKTTSYNTGFDYSFLNGLLNGKLDFYYKKSEDLLGTKEVNFTTGYTTLRVNSGAMANKGFELVVSSPWYKKNNLALTSTLMFAYNKNRVVKSYYNPTQAAHLAISGYLVNGKPYDALYAYRYGGLTSGGTDYQNGVPIILRADGTTTSHFQSNGTLLLDGSSTMLPEDVVYMGTKTPLVSASFTQNVQYKGFELSALFLYYGGHKMYLPSFGFNSTDGNEDWVAQSWTPTNSSSSIPKARIYYEPGISVVNIGSLEGMYIRSTGNVARGDFMRLRNIALSYTLPEKLSRKIKLDRFKITGQINNPWMWSAAGKQYDSEVQSAVSNTSTLRSWGLPTATTYLLRIDMSF